MKTRFVGAPLCSGLLLLVVLVPAAAIAGGTTVSCGPTQTKAVIASPGGVATQSMTFKNIPDASVNYTSGGNTSCVIVRFTAETSAGVNRVIIVRAFLDNVTAALPDEVRYSGSDGASYRAHGYEFIFPSVDPGKHVVHMQFRSEDGGPVLMQNHTTVVQYAP